MAYHPLESWRLERDLSRKELARRLRTSHQVVRRYIRGERVPSREMMVRIYRLTAGAVGPADFYDLPPKDGET